MSIWTSITEAVSQIGGSIAAYLSALATRKPSAPEKSVAFTIGMIALGAKMAKADGRVTADEVMAFKQVFHIPPENMSQVARVFDLAKQDIAGFDAYARQMAKLFGPRSPVLEDVIDALFHIATADRNVHSNELTFLGEVATLFGFSASEFATIKARNLNTMEGHAYEILGVNPKDSIDVIKSRYRQLVRENHPDIHIAQGMPEDMVELATERLAKINGAYESILKERGA